MSIDAGASWQTPRERTRAARLATVYTAAAFHNRRLSGPSAPNPGADDHAAWADAWDRAAALVGNVATDAALPALADRMEREAAVATDRAWQAVCRHVASEIRQLRRRLA